MSGSSRKAPAIPGLSWRPAQPDDVPALRQLQIVSNAKYGPLDPHAVGEHEALFGAGTETSTAGLCAVDASDTVVAFASASLHALAHEHRGYLDGLVHPDLRGRGLGRFLLEWAEAQARRLLAGMTSDRPSVLTIDFMDRRDDAVKLYERHGFQFKLAEDTMRRDLHQTIPDQPRPCEVEFVPWSQSDPHLFYEVYYDAFRDRPGFPGWTEPIWREAFTGASGFRPDLSLLATYKRAPVGYILCEIEQERYLAPARRDGWIVQMGVRPAWRGRGVGAALLAAAMRGFRTENLDDAMLDVNVNNPSARRVYEQSGFQAIARRSVFTKLVEASLQL